MQPTTLLSALAALTIASLSMTTRADITTCVSNCPIDENQMVTAFDEMSAANNGVVYVNSRSSSTTENGGTQFYVCNNAYSRRYITLDSTKQSNIENAYALCGGNAFYITESDGWSYGGDDAGISECGF